MPSHLSSRTTQVIQAVFASALIASALAPTASAVQRTKTAYAHVLAAESKSKAVCEAVSSRIFVATKWGSECIAYFATSGYETQRSAVVFFDGDISLEKFAEPDKLAETLASAKSSLQLWSDKLKARFVFVSRIGLNGSSGNHADRRKPREVMIMNAATDLLKQKLGLDRLALAGQSGGSTIAASMLSLGRTDVTCAVLGSGAFELVDLRHAELKAAGNKAAKAKLHEAMFDPANHVDSIAPDASRRILILGDEADTRTPFAQQQRYAESLATLGHHAKLIRVHASGAFHHGATAYTIPTAGSCLKGTADAKLIEANASMGQQRARAETASAAPAASGAAALMRSSLSASGR